jgi:hypothetical protein
MFLDLTHLKKYVARNGVVSNLRRNFLKNVMVFLEYHTMNKGHKSNNLTKHFC